MDHTSVCFVVVDHIESAIGDHIEEKKLQMKITLHFRELHQTYQGVNIQLHE